MPIAEAREATQAMSEAVKVHGRDPVLERRGAARKAIQGDGT
jgi:hypothetical protein